MVDKLLPVLLKIEVVRLKLDGRRNNEDDKGFWWVFHYGLAVYQFHLKMKTS